MDSSEIKRRLTYTEHFIPNNRKSIQSELSLYSHAPSKKESRRLMYEQILDSADALRRSYGNDLENYK